MSLAAAELEVRGSNRKGVGGVGNLPGLGEIFLDDNQRQANFGEETPA
jgi:hypothetical protein